jgi:hypothetical protein
MVRTGGRVCAPTEATAAAISVQRRSVYAQITTEMRRSTPAGGDRPVVPAVN